MASPKFANLNFTYKKNESEVWVLNTDSIPVDKDLIKDQQIVHLAPQSVGGNHKHPRTEWFIGIGYLVLVWIDDNGVKHEEDMYPKGQIRLITIPPFLAHAVVNRSRDKFAILFEMADGKMKDVESVNIYHSQ